MPRIKLEQHGQIASGENEGFFIYVHLDEKGTGGYYVFIVNDIDNPSDGGDYWAKDMNELSNLFNVSGWQVEWLD